MLIDVRVPYAKAGGPPEDWWNVQTLLNGVEVQNVLEANATEGWVKRHKLKEYQGGVKKFHLDLAGKPIVETLHGHVVCFITREIPNSAK